MDATKAAPLLLLSSLLTACQMAPVTDEMQNVAEPSNKPQKRMNILYIMSDDHAAAAVGVYGSRLAKLNPTPVLDQLANEGMRYSNVYVTNSICSPSRATILTGQYSQTNGALDLTGWLKEEKQYLPQLFKKAGYQTALIGKWHLKKEPGAFDYYEVLSSQGKYFNPNFRVRGDKPWPKNRTFYKGHSSDVITDLTIEWLKNRKSDKPFMLMHQFKAPHDMFEYAPRYESYLANVDVPEPLDLYQWKEGFGSVATRGDHDSLVREIGTSVSKRNLRRNMGEDLNIDTSLPDKEFTHQAYQKFLKAYLRCVKGVDDNIARLIRTLKEIGEYENTIIVYTADQGMMLGEHDYQDKRWIWEPSIHMPFIVHDPRMKNPGRTSDLLINNTDFAPFLLDLVDVEVPTYMHGRSFASTLQGLEPANWRSATYYRYWSHRKYHDVPAHFGVRSKDYKLIFFYGKNYLNPSAPFYDKKWVKKSGRNPNDEPTPAGWELYDLRKDPQETINVYRDPKYASVIKELKQEMKRQRELYDETDDHYPDLKKIIDQHWND